MSPRVVSCAWCKATNREHEPSCPVGREVHRIEELQQARERHPSATTAPTLTLVEAEEHSPDCDCSWWCSYFSAHADDGDAWTELR